MKNAKALIRFIEKSYKLYERKMYQVAYGILRDSRLAEDAVQEAFLKLMQCNTYFENPKADDCKRYMITVIKHASIDIYNKKKREQEIMFLSDREPAVEDTSVWNHLTEYPDIEELISCLPSKYYAVTNCLVTKNLSVRETAERLGITEANVRKRFERAKLLLKTMMKGSEENETKHELFG